MRAPARPGRADQRSQPDGEPDEDAGGRDPPPAPSAHRGEDEADGDDGKPDGHHDGRPRCRKDPTVSSDAKPERTKDSDAAASAVQTATATNDVPVSAIRRAPLRQPLHADAHGQVALLPRGDHGPGEGDPQDEVTDVVRRCAERRDAEQPRHDVRGRGSGWPGRGARA